MCRTCKMLPKQADQQVASCRWHQHGAIVAQDLLLPNGAAMQSRPRSYLETF